jgi:hypothetical protein
MEHLNHQGDMQNLLPLYFFDEPIRLTLRHHGKKLSITLTDLTNICIKLFGGNALFAEDALLHGEVLNVDNQDFSIEF